MKRVILLIICLCLCISLIFGVTFTTRQYVDRVVDGIPDFQLLLLDIRETFESFTFEDIFADGYQFGDILTAIEVFVRGFFQALLIPVKIIQFLFEYIWAVLPLPITM